MSATTVPAKELAIVRDLAKHVRELAFSDINQERKRLWTRHNDLQSERPMVLAEMSGVMDELGREPELQCRCEHDLARSLESELRAAAYRFEKVKDDGVIPEYLTVNWRVNLGNYGIKIPRHRGDNDGKLGSYVWEAPLKELPADLEKLTPRKPTVDREGTLRQKQQVEAVLDGILPVQIRGAFWWTQGLTWSAINLIGLEQLMLYMFDQPEGLHALMKFLMDDHIAVAEWAEKEGLLSLNNEADYIGSGGIGYTNDLPQPDYDPNGPVRLKDLWGLSESQETVGVGPDQFEEFIFTYQQPLAERFGLCYYGCCEPVHTRWHVIERLANLRKVSISPWCDEEKMAAALGNRYGYCRKPNPAGISTPAWDEQAIRKDLRRTLEVAGNCNLEFAMKDVHTLADEPSRLGRWVELARQEIEK
ncbi:MAG: hypothetical protein ACOCWJ_03545 [Verrucomicrobiota bacterium]